MAAGSIMSISLGGPEGVALAALDFADFFLPADFLPDGFLPTFFFALAGSPGWKGNANVNKCYCYFRIKFN